MEHFVKPTDSYGRNYQLLPTYVRDSAKYLQLMTGRSLDECVAFVQQAVAPGGPLQLSVPNALVLMKDQNGDRQKVVLPFTEYLDGVREKRQILSPTLAAYTHPDDNESLLAKYISGNLAARKKAKKEMFVAEMRGDKTMQAIKEAEQTTLKIKNNSLSGAHSSPFTILWNKSSHSTLTSTCRTATSYGNANNEKFLYGNRHYWAPEIAKANIISIINQSNYELIDRVVNAFQLNHPTVEQVMGCVLRGTRPYWRDEAQEKSIFQLVSSLSPIERSAFMFTGDFYHLAICNPKFVRDLLTTLSTKASQPLMGEEAEKWVGKMDDNLLAFVSLLCAKELAGGTMGDADGKGTPLKTVRPADYGVIAATAKNIIDSLDHYRDFIQAFWVTDNLPSSVYSLPNIVRRGAITSDTDSTIFTVKHWTEWYVGKLDFSEKSLAVAATMVYLASQLIRHILATVSGNIGAARKDITRLSMKNEYYFPVFTLTSRAKHYFAYISAREGNVYKKLETEIKGVALRNSNVPPFITKKAHDLIRALMDAVMRERKISLTAVLRYVAEIEEGIRKEVESGGYKLLPKTQIKDAASYKDPAVSNHIHYGMWEKVFAPKYGNAPEPPYVAIKVSLTTNNPSKLKEWVASIEERPLADRLTEWLSENSRKELTTLLLPEPILVMSGIPKELIPAINIRNLIFQTMEGFYLILEAIGYFRRNDGITRLVSDERWLIDEVPPDHVVGSLNIAGSPANPEPAEEIAIPDEVDTELLDQLLNEFESDEDGGSGDSDD